MKMSKLSVVVVALIGAFVTATEARAAIRVTEWMYQSLGSAQFEFVELTNVGDTSIDMSGWVYHDSGRDPAAGFSLSAFGIVQSGESVIFTDLTVDAFRTEWGLSEDSPIKIIGSATPGLGRGDEINIYDSNAVDANLMDRLTYGDEVFSGTIRTRWISGNPTSLAMLEDPTSVGWVFSGVDDIYGSWTSLDGSIGNPGQFSLIPEPAGASLVGMGLLGLLGLRRRRQK